MDDEIQNVAKALSYSISQKMDANLFESIVSLFNSGVLKHYVTELRTHVDHTRFNLTVEGANGVRFEGREKIIELEKKLAIAVEALECGEAALAVCETVHRGHYSGDSFGLKEIKLALAKLKGGAE